MSNGPTKFELVRAMLPIFSLQRERERGSEMKRERERARREREGGKYCDLSVVPQSSFGPSICVLHDLDGPSANS